MAKRYGEEINMIKKIEETLKLCDEIEKKQQKIYKVDISNNDEGYYFGVVLDAAELEGFKKVIIASNDAKLSYMSGIKLYEFDENGEEKEVKIPLKQTPEYKKIYKHLSYELGAKKKNN